jgi:ATP adenylyltransferase
VSYANHVFRFPAHLSSFPTDKLDTMLSTVFLSLLDLCISTIRHDPEYPPGKPAFNVLMSLEHMHLIPRRKDAHVLPETGQTLNVNALGFAGMLLVRSEEELEALKKESIGKILRSVGLESVHDIQVAGISAEGDQ